MASTRRDFIRTGASVVAATCIGSLAASGQEAKPAPAPTPAPAKPEAKPAAPAPAPAPATTQVAKPGVAVIGCGGIARFHARFWPKYGNIVALADVDKGRLESFNKDHAGGKAFTSPDYRAVLDRKDVDAVLIATPDHWHAKQLADALRAGKDVYVEKPLTLTIDEGRILCRIARETGRVLQIGTQQRSDERFLTAVTIAHAGRLGKIRHVTVAVGDTPGGAGFAASPVPAELDWDAWLGPAPKVPYIKERCHYTFRWWYEYSGGRMTDWGAHHVDIAQLAVAPDLPGPFSVEPVSGELPQPFERGLPTVANSYNTATKFNVKCTFSNGVDMFIHDRVDTFPSDNGILIEGDGGWLFVNRQQLNGPAVDALKDNPLPPNAVPAITKAGENPHEKHIINFFDCLKSRSTPLSDIFSHVRHLNTCHLANIALRLNRKLRWDATAHELLNDPEADSFRSRASRQGYEVA